MRRFAIALAAMLATAGHAQYQESVTVERLLVDVRVTNWNGEPITDLTAADFNVEVGGKRAVIESASWVEDVPTVDDESERPLNDGRLIVIFVQTDFARQSARMQGQLNFLRFAEKMVESFDASDRVAVFQFDSQLRFRLDFTADKEVVRDALRRTVYIEKLAPPPAVPSPSLASHLDRRKMERAAHAETALLLVGNALRPIAGTKTLLLMGWGLGERSSSTVRMKRDYEPARRALEAARTSIFALDTTYADFHDLEIGLSRAAEETGGYYAKTHVFPQFAVDRLQRTLSGHYELEMRRPDGLEPGTHKLEVRVSRRRAIVLAPLQVGDQK